jgi:hypothetical protein
MTRPRILPHVAVIAALITAVLPLTTLLDSGWFGASIAIVIAIVAAGYAGRWSNALLAIALQALTWFIGVWWAYPGRLGDLIGLDGWGVPRVLESAGAQIMTSVAPVDAGAPLRFALVGAIGLLTILVDATANACRSWPPSRSPPSSSPRSSPCRGATTCSTRSPSRSRSCC